MAIAHVNLFISRFFRLSLLDRYLIGELLPPFLFGVGLFSSLGVAVGTVFDLVRQVTEYGLLLDVAIKVLLLKVPEFAAYALPVSLLLTTLMTYSRLSGDSELIALRSVGISTYRLVVPTLIMSVAVTGLTFLFNELVVPAANYQAALTLERALNQEQPKFQENNIFYPEYTQIQDENGRSRPILSRLFYAEQFDGKNMKRLTVLDRTQDGVSQIVTSESASWNFRENKWDFVDGVIYLISSDGSFRNILRFDRQMLQLPRTPLDLAQRARGNQEMNIAQARERLEILKVSGDEAELRKLKVRIQQKYAFPFVCIVFALLGAALGNQPQQTSRATSFGISVVVVFSYYLLFFVTGAMGLVGIFSPFFAAWLANMFGIVVGGLLLFRSANQFS
ncbi:LptF/LptG family permease [Spirulina subsalsa FACHB-351]|uniref:LptF/LptG family permease n=1 Tax=Spirulina subsalsa FACHB-351 TaxID=234711 RepID=A0ABT3L151_9CYAN|nr:LptF/LptG family permease [Spirulina subsalsa]MCW6035225.1 LptF/LptG family permease [Spirulina subsalsa FACHB-351]